jgi:aspartokinase/homoserine dehydrogenase 1
MSWKVHKFGGSTLFNSHCIKLLAKQFFPNKAEPSMIVVSALKGITDLLQELIDLTEAHKDTSLIYRTIKDRHIEITKACLDTDHANYFLDQLNEDLTTIQALLSTVREIKRVPLHNLDKILGFGEIWSANLITEYFKSIMPADEVKYCDARDFMIAQKTEMGVTPLWDKSLNLLEKKLLNTSCSIYIATGFIAKNESGIQCTLGRNGSDYSASILALLLDADELTFWKDVDGVLSADPRIVPEAKIIKELSYNEAMELSYFGAQILHPKTMMPAITKSIPIRIRNLFNTDYKGTVIKTISGNDQLIIKGVTGIDKIALITLSGAGMIGVPGTAYRLFGALREAGISVLMISQGSSEHSICFGVQSSDAEIAKSFIEKEFDIELNNNFVNGIDVQTDCAIMAIIGDGMTGSHGVSAKFFSSLGIAGINIKAIAQGASERNISVVISSVFLNKAIKAVHSSFYLSEKTISIGVIGAGPVGQALINQLINQIDTLNTDFNVSIKLRGIANSKCMILGESVSSRDLSRLIDKTADKLNMDTFIDHLKADHIPHTVLIDCTASSDIAAKYAGWLDKGMHVITANKIAHSGNIDVYKHLKNITRKKNFHFLYEATVGAGLPIIKSLKDLIDSGDKVLEVSGIFSGTLAYLFNKYEKPKTFSSILLDACKQGYTEPDPRDDLSGLDVARKVVILARECGHHIEINDVKVQSLIPSSLNDVPLKEFLENLNLVDDLIDPYLIEAEGKSLNLRYVARIDIHNNIYEVSLQEFPAEHPFSNINLTDNIFQFSTKRYALNPLIIIGPGAGPDVTAAGIFSDILRLTSMLAVYKLPENN